MTDAELIDFLTVYEAGEVLSSESDIDYVISRLPSFFSGRPKLVSYEMTDADRIVFDRLEAEAIADGLDMEAGFEEYGDEKYCSNK